MADLLLRLIAEDAASAAFENVGKGVKAIAGIVYDFAKESTKAFMEAERVQKQLARAAGENTEAFSNLADQMSRQLAIEDEEIKKLQTLALSYGVLPQNVEGATKAVLDYAAATGRDATQAMQQLINGVEAGTGSLGRMGVTFDVTGNKAQDLENAISELNKKFGGAAAADADTLEGRVRNANIAVGELEEGFGALFAAIEAKTGMLSGFAVQLRSLAEYGLFDSAKADAWREQGVPEDEIRRRLGVAVPSTAVKPGVAENPTLTFGELELKGNKPKKGSKPGKDEWGWGPYGDPEKSFDGWLNEYQEYNQKKLDVLNETALKEAAEATKRYQMEVDAEEKHDEAMLEAKRKASDAMIDLIEEQTERERRALERQTSMWMNLGIAIGDAVFNGIVAALDKESTDLDKAKAGYNIAKTVINTIASMFGYGQLTQLGFGLGEGVGTLGQGWFSGTYSNPYAHDGKWIQRYHSGGWPGIMRDERPAILQVGERVLSRREVSNMGGAGAVDAAARGRGGGQTYNIYAFDAASMLDQFGGGRAERAMMNAARTNSGSMRALLGAG